MRCFLAVPVNGAARDRLVEWRSRARQQLPDARWVKPENYHLTVKFYGDLNVQRLQWLVQSLKEPLSSFRSFELELEGLGVFPSWERPRVLWAGVGDGIEHMQDLAGIVEAVSAGIKLPVDKRDYRPHLTLARFRGSWSGHDVRRALADGEQQRWGRLPVTGAIMYISRLTPSGPIYTVHETFNFA